MRTTIYALVDPRKPHALRYVGKTSLTLPVRLNCHVSKSKHGGVAHSHCWIRKLLRVGVRPQIEELQVVEGDGCAAEVQMIALCRLMRVRLTNITAGGDVGGRGFKHTKETRRRMSAAKKGKPSPKRGYTTSPEVRAKISAGLRRHFEKA